MNIDVDLEAIFLGPADLCARGESFCSLERLTEGTIGQVTYRLDEIRVLPGRIWLCSKTSDADQNLAWRRKEQSQYLTHSC